MRMYDVHDDAQSQAVGFVDELLERFGSTETGRRREKTGHVVTERPVVGVFLNGHDLNGVVAGLGDTG